ncbi:hypothetical protein SDC9_175912 [bioreactor metagenome]|uniref:Uncharacterized protein n=1 Tax=bioreactor metagenome TaxID=1076179 RepID=A0A645GQG7_9ZZZZ
MCRDCIVFRRCRSRRHDSQGFFFHFPFQELGSNSRVKNVCKNIFFGICNTHFLCFFFPLLVFRLEKVRRTAVNRFFITYDFSNDFRSYRSRGAAVEPTYVVFYLFRNDLVAFTHKHVKHSLCAYDLACGSNKRGIPEFFPDSWHLFKHCPVLVKCILLF